MAKTECTNLPGHFVIWTKGGIKIIEVPFDQSYWIASESKLEEFFRNKVIPGILMPSSMRIGNFDDEVKKLSLDGLEIDFTIKEGNMLTNEVEKILTEEKNASSQMSTIHNQYEMDSVEGIHEELIDSCYSIHQNKVEKVPEEVKQSTVPCDVHVEDINENNRDITEEEWILGCENKCIEEKQSKYSSIKGCMIACDANIKCKRNTWYHMACEGFRRMPAALCDEKTKVMYVCQLCRKHHTNEEELASTNSFVEHPEKEDEDEIVFQGTSTDGQFSKKLKYHHLGKNEEEIIINGGWHSDIYINCAQSLITKKHQYIGGLENCGLAETCSFSVPTSEFIQILNSTGQHWVTLTSIGCELGKVKIYDSSFRCVTGRMKTIMLNIPSKHIQIELPPFQKQPNGDDCGLFAIASAVCLAEGQDPSEVNWDVHQMRTHLLECLQKGCLEKFPTCDDPTSRLPYKSYKISNS